MLNKLCDDLWYVTVDSDYIKFRVEYPANREIFLDREDISNDGILFLPKIYPTLDDEDLVLIGDALYFSFNKCVNREIVGVRILDTSMNDMLQAKRVLENIFATA